MNTVAFEVVASEHSREHGEVRIAIDGRDLRQWVAEAERESAVAEGHPSLAGSYAGLAADEHVRPPSCHFLGSVHYRIYDYDGKVQILGCECGEPGCWPLICRIEADASRVEWSDFEQPHRRGRWRYTGFGPFSFARLQFEKALDALSRHGAG